MTTYTCRTQKHDSFRGKISSVIFVGVFVCWVSFLTLFYSALIIKLSEVLVNVSKTGKRLQRMVAASASV